MRSYPTIRLSYYSSFCSCGSMADHIVGDGSSKSVPMVWCKAAVW